MLLTGWVAMVSIAAAAETAVPFVSGYERFGRHDEVDNQLAGEVLLSELSCTACHASEPIPAKGGPQLDSIARRVNEKWLRDYLASPASVKPGTTMPDLLWGRSQASKDEAITALVAFLSTLRAEYPAIQAGGANPLEFEFWKKGDAGRGAALYHEVGCVTCHAPDGGYEVGEMEASSLDDLLDELDPDELADMGLASSARRVESVPHGDLASKYSRLSLTHFLFQPEHVRPGGRMPNMKLAPHEAADIAAYLLRRSDPLFDRGPDVADPATSFESRLPGTNRSASSVAGTVDPPMIPLSTDAALIETGRQLFSTLGCANCHEAGNTEGQRFESLDELALARESESCLVDGSGGATYGLGPGQVTAINAAIVGLQSPRPARGSGPDLRDRVDRTLLQMNCYGCHTRDGLGGVGRDRKGYFKTVGGVDLGDEGRLPPPLSGVGRKLKPEWLKRVLRGDSKTTLRPHMTIRMPRFSHADVTALADRLGEVDGVDPAPASEVFATSSPGEITSAPGETSGSDGEIGRGLMEIGCTECHVFDGQAMPGVIGVDLAGVPDRVFPSWFHDFVMNPGRMKSRTRMPNFFPDGKSQVPQVLGGDAFKQIAAMWDYLEDAQRLGIPGKIAAERAKSYHLTPADHPLMLRTFMNGVGTHAIAVGFPAGVHFAVDAQQGRLAIAWRNDFLDARSTWFERFTPPIDPLDPKPQGIGKGPNFFQSDSLDEAPVVASTEFLGYQLDRDRIPTFRYRWGACQIEDRIVPDENGGLRRRIRLLSGDRDASDTAELWFRVIEGDHVTQEATHRFRNETGLSVQLLSPAPAPMHPAHRMIPLRDSDDLELIYQW